VEVAENKKSPTKLWDF